MSIATIYELNEGERLSKGFIAASIMNNILSTGKHTEGNDIEVIITCLGLRFNPKYTDDIDNLFDFADELKVPEDCATTSVPFATNDSKIYIYSDFVNYTGNKLDGDQLHKYLEQYNYFTMNLKIHKDKGTMNRSFSVWYKDKE